MRQVVRALSSAGYGRAIPATPMNEFFSSLARRWGDGAPYVVLAALAAVTWRVRLVARGAPSDAVGRETCAKLARGRLVIAEETTERWTESPFPASRVAWDELRIASTAAAITGVVLPNDPRLIDLLRNPDIIEARDDLKLSFG